MRTQRFAVMARFVSSLLTLVTLNASQDFIDYLAPPPTLQQKMYGAAMVVARILVVTQGPPTAQSSDAHPLVVRHHTIQILESFKNTSARTEGPTPHLEQYGGTVAVNGQTVTTDDGLGRRSA